MGLFDGKTPSERNKMIAAMVLGLISLIALYMAFGRGLFSGSSTTSVTVKTTPTPKPGSSPAGDKFSIPTQQDQALDNEVTPIVYNPNDVYAPDAGRNIFEFYEPPPPCKPGKDCPTPTPTIPKATPIPTPTPVPTPPIILTGNAPQMVYAGAAGFRLDITGSQIPADAKIYFNNSALETTASPTHLHAQVPANLIAQEGPKAILVKTPDGRLFSNQLALTAQAPPRPNLQYIGMIGRKRYNNDTAYVVEPGKDKPIGARLNDVVGGRFRLVDISPAEIIVEDTSLGFRHHIPLQKTPTGQSQTGFSPFGAPGQQQYFPPRPIPQPPNKDDVDDNIPPKP